MVEQLDLNFPQVLEQGKVRSYEYPLQWTSKCAISKRA